MGDEMPKLDSDLESYLRTQFPVLWVLFAFTFQFATTKEGVNSCLYQRFAVQAGRKLRGHLVQFL